jgi:hypothetical protein
MQGIYHQSLTGNQGQLGPFDPSIIFLVISIQTNISTYMMGETGCPELRLSAIHITERFHITYLMKAQIVGKILERKISSVD